MARNEDFDNSFWDDDQLDRLTASPVLLYIWSWTNARCGMSGLYKVRQSTMIESKVPEAEIPAALDALARENMAHHVNGWLWVRARTKRLRTKTPQMAKAVIKDLRKVPAGHPLLVAFMGEYGDASWLRPAFADAPDLRVAGSSGTYPGSQAVEPNSGNLSEVPLSGQGKGLGPKGETGTPVARARKAVDPAVQRLCRVLADLIRQRDPKATVKPDSDRWSTDMRLLVADRDGDLAEVERVLRWSQADPFWQQNILSPGKLRAQFTQLLLKADAGQVVTMPARRETPDEARRRRTAQRLGLDHGGVA